MARMKVKASPARARTSVPGDTAETMKWVKISLGAGSSRYVVHYHLDNGTDEELKPICGSKNSNNRKYVKRIGEHVDCTKCITQRGAIRLAAANAAMAEARIAQQVKDIEKAAENVANAKPRSAPPVPPVEAPMAPVLTLPIPAPAAVPAQRTNGYGPSLFQAPAYPAPPPVDDEDDEDYDEDDFDETEPATEEAPQMTAPTVTPLTAFPSLPTRPTPLIAEKPAVVTAAPKPVPTTTPEPVAVAEPTPPIEDDVIVVHAETYEVTLIHPVTRKEMDPVIVQASSEEEAEALALDYFEITIVKKTTRIRAARRS